MKSYTMLTLVLLAALFLCTYATAAAEDIETSVHQRRRRRGRPWTRCVGAKLPTGPNPPPRCFKRGHLRFWRNHEFQFNPQMSDNFYANNGHLNRRKWEIHDPHRGIGNWAGRQPGMFIKENVWMQKRRFNNFGGLRIKAKGHPKDTQSYTRVFDREDPKNPGDTFEGHGYGEYSMGMLSSKRAVRYGYFEVESKIMPTQLVNSWWFSSRENGIWTEIDVYENSHVNQFESKWNIDMRLRVVPNAHAAIEPGQIIDPGNLISAKPAWYKHWEPLMKKPHTYGLLWTKERITFFFEGLPFVSIPNKYWHRKLFVRFDVETNIEWHGIAPNVWRLRRTPQIYAVHYFRCWAINHRPRGRRGPARPVARVEVSEIMDRKTNLASATRMSRTKGVQRDVNDVDKLEAGYFAANEKSTDVDWTNNTAPIEAHEVKNPYCLIRAPYGNEQFMKENHAPYHMSSHQYVKAYQADAEPYGMVDWIKDQVSYLFQY